MKYTLTYSCGHTGTVQLYGKTEERERKIKYYEEYGQSGDENVVSSWSEEYQARLYRDNIRMFDNIPNLRGVSPWILFDFRSPFRFHPTNQDGWNRKGLISDQGMRKKDRKSVV